MSRLEDMLVKENGQLIRTIAAVFIVLSILLGESRFVSCFKLAKPEVHLMRHSFKDATHKLTEMRWATFSEEDEIKHDGLTGEWSVIWTNCNSTNVKYISIITNKALFCGLQIRFKPDTNEAENIDYDFVSSIGEGVFSNILPCPGCVEAIKKNPPFSLPDVIADYVHAPHSDWNESAFGFFFDSSARHRPARQKQFEYINNNQFWLLDREMHPYSNYLTDMIEDASDDSPIYSLAEIETKKNGTIIIKGHEIWNHLSTRSQDEQDEQPIKSHNPTRFLEADFSLTLLGNGFHKKVVYSFDFHPLHSIALRQCDLLIMQPLSPSYYVEVMDLEKYYSQDDETQVKLLRDMLSETPMNKASGDLLLLHKRGNVSSTSWSETIHFPVHWRYHEISDSMYSNTTFFLPSVYTRCYASDSERQDIVASWTPVLFAHLQYKNAYEKIPVGHLGDSDVVLWVTSLFSLLSVLYVSFQSVINRPV